MLGKIEFIHPNKLSFPSSWLTTCRIKFLNFYKSECLCTCLGIRWTDDWLYQTSLNQPWLLHTQSFLRKCFLDCFYGFRILRWILKFLNCHIPHFPSATRSDSVHNPCGAISHPTNTEYGRNHGLGTSHPYPCFIKSRTGLGEEFQTKNKQIITS